MFQILIEYIIYRLKYNNYKLLFNLSIITGYDCNKLLKFYNNIRYYHKKRYFHRIKNGAKFYLSNKMSKILGVPLNCKFSRMEYTIHIHRYIKEHCLQSNTNKRIILLDKKLNKLFGYPKPPVTYFNLQSYLKLFILIE